MAFDCCTGVDLCMELDFCMEVVCSMFEETEDCIGLACCSKEVGNCIGIGCCIELL